MYEEKTQEYYALNHVKEEEDDYAYGSTWRAVYAEIYKLFFNQIPVQLTRIMFEYYGRAPVKNSEKSYYTPSYYYNANLMGGRFANQTYMQKHSDIFGRVCVNCHQYIRKRKQIIVLYHRANYGPSSQDEKDVFKFRVICKMCLHAMCNKFDVTRNAGPGCQYSDTTLIDPCYRYLYTEIPEIDRKIKCHYSGNNIIADNAFTQLRFIGINHTWSIIRLKRIYKEWEWLCNFNGYETFEYSSNFDYRE